VSRRAEGSGVAVVVGEGAVVAREATGERRRSRRWRRVTVVVIASSQLLLEKEPGKRKAVVVGLAWKEATGELQSSSQSSLEKGP